MILNFYILIKDIKDYTNNYEIIIIYIQMSLIEYV